MGDSDTMSRLCKYRPFNDEFIDARRDLRDLDSSRPEVSVPRAMDISKLIRDEYTISATLNEELRTLFLRVPFEDWVRKALGLYPCSVMKFHGLLLRIHLRLKHAQILKVMNVFLSLSYMCLSSSRNWTNHTPFY